MRKAILGTLVFLIGFGLLALGIGWGFFMMLAVLIWVFIATIRDGGSSNAPMGTTGEYGGFGGERNQRSPYSRYWD